MSYGPNNLSVIELGHTNFTNSKSNDFESHYITDLNLISQTTFGQLINL
jgi:hypothetical protein